MRMSKKMRLKTEYRPVQRETLAVGHTRRRSTQLKQHLTNITRSSILPGLHASRLMGMKPTGFKDHVCAPWLAKKALKYQPGLPPLEPASPTRPPLPTQRTTAPSPAPAQAKKVRKRKLDGKSSSDISSQMATRSKNLNLKEIAPFASFLCHVSFFFLSICLC